MTEEEFIELARAKYLEINRLNELPGLLEYEQGFVDIWMDLGRSVAQKNLGVKSKDRRKKKD
ncbi:hypothetical protein [Arundinibacter roseus]|uniref:Uncharacterized protein n=1 Tax=Arundinibacter roseus TaxID=2070510 RepID=A0A4R4JXN9_9BACT|nr:hypothetical protein [Arundinibacter roseus]TDB59558.1 hypothetical protein EZE20_22430 [Arundinibacter roseus]